MFGKPTPALPNNTMHILVETTTERVARLRREVAEKSKVLEDLQRMEAEAAEQAMAEEKAEAQKAAEEREAAEKAAAEEAAIEEAAAKEAAAGLAKASAESNRQAADNSLKYTGETIKNAISAYLAQRKAEAADKTLVGKLDEELTPYFRDALSTTAIEPQKRKFKDEKSDDGRPSKAAKK